MFGEEETSLSRKRTEEGLGPLDDNIIERRLSPRQYNRLCELVNNIQSEYRFYLTEILHACSEMYPLTFSELFEKICIRGAKGLDKGRFAHCLKLSDGTVLKMVEVPRKERLYGYYLKVIHSEVVVTRKLDELLTWNIKNHCSSFIKVLNLNVVWDEPLLKNNSIDNSEQSERFYVVYHLENGGMPLGDMKEHLIRNPHLSMSVCTQLSLALAVAEIALEFEHRDLHWKNILLKETKEEKLYFRVDGILHCVQSHGIKITLIDFGNSRLTHHGRPHYVVLNPSDAPVHNIVRRRWRGFFPQTNVYQVCDIVKALFSQYTLSNWFYNNRQILYNHPNCKELSECLLKDHFWSLTIQS